MRNRQGGRNVGNRIFGTRVHDMGKAAASTILSLIREVVFGVGFTLVLPVWYGLDGVLYSMPLSDVLTFLVAVLLIVGTYRELGENGGKPVPLK